MAQLCGIDGVLYYAPTLFAQAGLPSQTASFLASGVSAILMLLISIPAVLFADRWDRRTSVVSGGVILSGCMLLIGCLYVTDSVHAYGSGRWVVVVSIFAFALTYCVTWAVAGKIYASEIQPNNTRAAANSLAQGVSFFTNWLVAITTPIFLANSSFGAYFLFGFLSLGTVAVLALYMPETRGLSLESIQETFHKPPMITNLAGHVRRLFGLTVAGARSGSGSEGPTGGQREDGEAIEMSGAVRVASEGPRNSSSAGMAVAGPLRIGAMVV
ncbi:hypothetical protein LTR39_000940 [Cryomyces antarcticus]|nr:hypothetical protein LTR39_000940 [Cryomyces antarcticus]